MPSLTTLQAEMAKFMVPVGPNGDEDPPGLVSGDGGWPDKPPTPLPSPTTGLTPSSSPNNTTITASGLSPGAFTGGYATLSKDANIPGATPPPSGFYGEGIKILSNTATSITLEKPLDDGTGEHTALVAATADDQVLFNVGDTNIALVLSVKRLAPATDGAVDASVVGHNLNTGQIGIGEMSPPIQTGHQVEFKYRRKLAGGHAAGLGYSFVPARAPPGGAPPPLTVGQAWSEAYGAFFGTASPAPAPGTYTPAIQAMRSVMDSLSAIPGMGAVSFTAGLVAFWGVVSASAPAIFASVPSTITVVPPPTIFGVGPSILAAMLSAHPPPLMLPAPPAVGPGWTPAQHNADVTTMATEIMLASQGGQIIAQPGPAPVPTPIVFA
jgi:hypothetical protein